MAAQLTTIANLLKRQYLDVMGEVFQEYDGAFREALKRRVDGVGGDTFIPVRLKRNWGIGARADRAALPEAGNQEWGQHQVGPKWNYARVEVSGQAIDRTAGSRKKAFLKAFVAESKFTLKSLRKQLNRQTWGTEEGALAAVASAAAAVITVTDVADGPRNDLGFNYGTDNLHGGEGMEVDFLDASDSFKVIGAGSEISSINRSTSAVTLDAAPGTAPAVGDLVILKSGLANGAAAPRAEMEGIVVAVDDNTVSAASGRATANEYHGLSRSTYPKLSSNVIGNSGTARPFDETLVEALFKKVAKVSGVNPMTEPGYELRTSLGTHSEYVETQLPIKRFHSRTLEGGYDGLDYSGVAVIPDVDAPPMQMFLLNWNNLKLVETRGLSWRDFDGKALGRVSDLDSYEARLVYAAEMCWINVNEMGVIRDIDETQVTF